MKILYTILILISYYVAYWIFRSILFSFADETWTLEIMVKAEWILAGVIGFIFCIAVDIMFDNDDWIYSGCAIGGITFVTLYIPYSIGLAVLYNLVVISGLCYALWKSTSFINNFQK